MLAASEVDPPTAHAPIESAAKFIGGIPVRNLWLLMLYASDLRHEKLDRVGTEDNPDKIAELVAEILCDFVEMRLIRNLSYGYETRQRVVSRVRGRILHLRTERNQLLKRGLIACKFDELTVDTRRNRYVRLALERVSTLVIKEAKGTKDSRNLRHRCLEVGKRLEALGVGAWVGPWSGGHGESFGMNDRQDRPMLDAATLALDLALLTEDAGHNALYTAKREEYWVRTLFEKAVCGMYRHALGGQGWTVKHGGTLQWPVGDEIGRDKSSGIDAILPGMRLDIQLDHEASKRRVIIDTKFTELFSHNNYGQLRLKSGYIYQMYAYLRSQEGRGDARASTAEGILLHPAIGDGRVSDTNNGNGDRSLHNPAMINEWADIQGHRIRFATVDLAASATEIRRQLLSVIGM